MRKEISCYCPFNITILSVRCLPFLMILMVHGKFQSLLCCSVGIVFFWGVGGLHKVKRLSRLSTLHCNKAILEGIGCKVISVERPAHSPKSWLKNRTFFNKREKTFLIQGKFPYVFFYQFSINKIKPVPYLSYFSTTVRKKLAMLIYCTLINDIFDSVLAPWLAAGGAWWCVPAAAL